MNLARFLLFHPISKGKSTIGLIMLGSSNLYALITGEKESIRQKLRLEEANKEDTKRKQKKRNDHGINQESELELVEEDEQKSLNNSLFFERLSDDLSEDNEDNNILQIPLDEN